jgi:CRISPR/Cas system-associated endonuclease Cas1
VATVEIQIWKAACQDCGILFFHDPELESFNIWLDLSEPHRPVFAVRCRNVQLCAERRHGDG